MSGAGPHQVSSHSLLAQSLSFDYNPLGIDGVRLHREIHKGHCGSAGVPSNH